MSFLKKIGNLFSKMTSSRKNEKLVEALNQKAKPKEDPVQDIEDLIKTQYSSPLQTRSQQIKRTQIKAAAAVEPETTAANLKIKPIQLLKSQSLINANRDVKAQVKQRDHGIVQDISLVSETDASQPLSLGLETVPSTVSAEFGCPAKEIKNAQQSCDSGTSAPSSKSSDVENVTKKVAVKAARTAGKGKRSIKTTPMEENNVADDAVNKSSDPVAGDRSRKAKSTRKSKPLVASKEKVEEKPVAKKRTTKKETKEKKEQEITEKAKHTTLKEELMPMPVPSTSAKPSKKALKLTPFQYNPHKINNSTALKVEDDADEVKEESKRKRASPLKAKDISDSEPEIKLEKWQPEKWPLALENIKLMRTFQEAPVDQMGCHKCCDENADEKTKRFQHLVALMLSSQTRDQITYEVMQRLRENTCTPTSIVQMNPDELMQILHPVSFYKSKTKYLQNTAKILIEKYDSDIPKNVNEMIKLPGVGRKMAHICMSVAWDMITGIGVDTHVHRISNRLGWVRTATKEPEQTRKQLEHWLPPAHWRDVNYLLVGFGQTLCTPVRPKCDQCLNNAFCPSANVTQASPKKEIKMEKPEES